MQYKIMDLWLIMSVIIYNPLREIFPNAKHVCQFFMSLSNIIVKHAIKDQKGILFKYVEC